MNFLLAAVLMSAAFLPWVARAAGGGAGAFFVFSIFPEIIVGFIISLAAWLWWGNPLIVPLATIWSCWCGINLGHTRVYTMGGVAPTSTKEPSSIEAYGAQWIWERAGRSIHTPAYSWWIMGIKGLMTGMPLGAFAIITAILWPAAYWLAFRVFKIDDGTCEWLSGIVLNITIVALAITHIIFA